MEYAIIETLNGNMILKELSKTKETDTIEIELFATDLIDAKKQLKAHKTELRKAGLL